jgi:hypothetical protein
MIKKNTPKSVFIEVQEVKSKIPDSVFINVGEVKSKTPDYALIEVQEDLKEKAPSKNHNKLLFAARQGKARKNDSRSYLGDGSSNLSKPLQVKQEENTWKSLNVRSAAKQSSKCVMNEMIASTSSVRSAAHCTNNGARRRKLRHPFGRPYGKRTEEKCPVCLLTNLVLARGKLKCPVCGYKRDSFYYLNLLSIREARA